MRRTKTALLAKIAASTAALTLMASAALAQPARTASRRNNRENVVRTLGGTTRFSPPLRTVDDLRRMAGASGNQRDLNAVLDSAGLSNIKARVIQAMTKGEVTETTFAPGGHLEWMALRRTGRASLLRNVRWAGASGFDGFGFKVANGTTEYTFIVPKSCGNLSLVGSAPIARVAAAPPPPAPPPPAPQPPRAAPAPPPVPPPLAPLPPPPPPRAVQGPPPPQPPAKMHPFVAGFYGKERRTREFTTARGL
jgi:hypothetical protein